MGGEYWPHSNGTAKTYGDITDAYKVKQENVSTIYRSNLQSEKTGLPLWLKLVLFVATLVLLADKFNLFQLLTAK